MKALTLNGYDGLASLKIADVAVPELRPRDVLIAVRAASVNPVDTKIAQGYARARMDLAFPHVLGRDCAGVIVALGGEVTAFQIGDEVYGAADQTRWGTHAEQVAIDVGTVAAKPKTLDFRAAAAVPIAALSAYAGLVTVGQVKPGDKVLIHAGAGGVGSFAIQLAKHLGATVATTASKHNLEFVRALGADIAIDYRSDDFAKKLSDYDLVFDLMGGDVRYRSFDVLRPGGAIVHISVPPMTQPAPRADVTVKPAAVSYAANLLADVGALIDSGALKPPVSEVLPFSDAIAAYEKVMTGHARGKIVLDIGAE